MKVTVVAPPVSRCPDQHHPCPPLFHPRIGAPSRQGSWGTASGAKGPIAAPEGWGPAGIVVWGLWLGPVGSRTPHTASSAALSRTRGPEHWAGQWARLRHRRLRSGLCAQRGGGRRHVTATEPDSEQAEWPLCGVRNHCPSFWPLRALPRPSCSHPSKFSRETGIRKQHCK